MAPSWRGSMTMLKHFCPLSLSSTESDGATVSSELTLSNLGDPFGHAGIHLHGRPLAGEVAPLRTSIYPAGAGSASCLTLLLTMKELGIPIPESGSRRGSLSVRFSGLNSDSEGTVAVRTTRTNDGVRSGWAHPGVSTGFQQPVYLFGLRHDDADRSGLVVHKPGNPGEWRYHLEANRYLW